MNSEIKLDNTIKESMKRVIGDFDVSDFKLFKKQETINKGSKKLKQLKYNKDKVANRVIKILKKQLRRKLTSDEIYSIKNYKGMN